MEDRTLDERLEHLEDELVRLRAREQRRRRRRLLAIAALIVIPVAAWAATLDVPYTFTNGTIADAEEVNANFADVESAVNANLQAHQSDFASLQGQINAIPAQSLPICNFFAGAPGACPGDRTFSGWVGRGDGVSCDSSIAGGPGVPADATTCTLCCRLP